MANPALRILEEQVDELAERVVDAETRAERLVELLSKPNVLERLGLEAWQIRDLGHVGLVGHLAAIRHRTDPHTRANKEEADLTLKDLQRRVATIEEAERARLTR